MAIRNLISLPRPILPTVPPTMSMHRTPLLGHRGPLFPGGPPDARFYRPSMRDPFSMNPNPYSFSLPMRPPPGYPDPYAFMNTRPPHINTNQYSRPSPMSNTQTYDPTQSGNFFAHVILCNGI